MNLNKSILFRQPNHLPKETRSFQFPPHNRFDNNTTKIYEKDLAIESVMHQISYLMATRLSLKRDPQLSVPASQRVWPDYIIFIMARINLNKNKL